MCVPKNVLLKMQSIITVAAGVIVIVSFLFYFERPPLSLCDCLPWPHEFHLFLVNQAATCPSLSPSLSPSFPCVCVEAQSHVCEGFRVLRPLGGHWDRARVSSLLLSVLSWSSASWLFGVLCNRFANHQPDAFNYRAFYLINHWTLPACPTCESSGFLKLDRMNWQNLVLAEQQCFFLHKKVFKFDRTVTISLPPSPH